MMNILAILVPLVSLVFFPWPLTIVLALVSAVYEPLMPLSIGLLADMLYYTVGSGHLPMAALSGLVASIMAFFVRSRMRTGIIR